MEMHYFFGGIRIFTSVVDSVENIIINGVKNKKTIIYRDFHYGFFDIEEMGEFVTGFLVKYKDTSYECVDTESKRRRLSNLHNASVAEARFFVHPKTELIAYNTSGNLISKSLFANIFKQLFESIYDNFFFQLNFETINEPYDLKTIIHRFTLIKRVEITLIPSNPRFNQNWENPDRRLKDLNATEYKEVIENTSPGMGLNIEQEEISEKFSMADDGYGDVSVSGILDDGTEKTYKLKKNQETILAPNNSNDASTVLNRLMVKFSEIFKRFTK